MSNESKGHYVCPWTKFFICIKHLIFSKRHISLEKQKTYFSLTDKQQSGLQKTLFAVIKLMSSITTERLRQSQAFNDIQWSRSHLLFMLNVVPQDEEVFSKVSKDFKVQQFLDQCLENPRIPPLPDFRMSMMKKKDVFTLFHIDVDVERDRSWNSTRYCCFCTRKASWGLADNQSEWRLLLCSKCKSTSEAKLRNVANCNTDVQKMIFFLQNQHLTTRSPAAHRGSKSDRLRKEYSPALTVGTEAVSRNPPAKPATRAPFKPKATVSDSLDSPGWRNVVRGKDLFNSVEDTVPPNVRYKHADECAFLLSALEMLPLHQDCLVGATVPQGLGTAMLEEAALYAWPTFDYVWETDIVHQVADTSQSTTSILLSTRAPALVRRNR
ncbi:hypothetical protein GUITHDRAFT_104552 [Guillardia theta CCMP2712]|uniref:Uncharacterized protein n=1 Tax=Guillardia theta (strain CCMP2712) TaxID=905079 RepID=L1JLZ0_GUITC|nr:hypothetical protein GUITHDRAFT_104552 [Guillardia theta CCMP2712]EKX49591.1 hypothetical protein GUITHDRAFT_104552 [Guillardia theta CCMP2712]|eukprot:XP_005836571.1 hypothetical protein GUITHDRAFT_104552 [Guillardia theta CCMP2712]